MKYITLVFFLLISSNVYACRCIKPSQNDSFKNSESIVFGKVLEVATLPDYDGSISIIKVLKSWKDKTNETIAIISITNCSYSFEKNKEYVLFLNKDRYGLYSTDRCSGNTLIDKDNTLINWLDSKNK